MMKKVYDVECVNIFLFNLIYMYSSKQYLGVVDERFKKKLCENHHINKNIHIESSKIKIQDLRKRT